MFHGSEDARRSACDITLSPRREYRSNLAGQDLDEVIALNAFG
jgi:hypothetical protein